MRSRCRRRPRRGAPDHRGDPSVPSQMFYTPQWSSGWSAGWERVVCNRWSIGASSRITRAPSSSSSSRNRRVSCGFLLKSIRSGLVVQHGALASNYRRSAGQKPGASAAVSPGNGGKLADQPPLRHALAYCPARAGGAAGASGQ